MKKIAINLLFIFLCLVVPLTLTLGNSLLITYSQTTYHNLLIKNQEIILTKQERTLLAKSLFQGITRQRSVQTVLETGKWAFSEKEIVHMMDVSNLVKLLTILFGFLFFSCVFLYFFLRKKSFHFESRLLLTSIILSISMPVIILFNFEPMFTLFHHLTFHNDFWLLDPSKDLLINIFPLSFFIIQFAKVSLMTFLELLVLYFGLRVQQK